MHIQDTYENPIEQILKADIGICESEKLYEFLLCYSRNNSFVRKSF